MNEYKGSAEGTEAQARYAAKRREASRVAREQREEDE